MFDMKKHLQKYHQICFKRQWEISNEIYYKLGQCDGLVSALDGLPLSPEVTRNMLSVSFRKGAVATTAIEGNTLTEEDVRLIQEGKSEVMPSRKYQEQEIQNVLDALNSIRNDVVQNGIVAPVSPDLIRSFHLFVGKDLGEAFEAVPGHFRDNEVTVGAYRPPDHRDVPELVNMMCDWLLREFHYSEERNISFSTSVIEAIVAHLYLVWIHPFGDGNGRTARLLEFYLLLRGRLPDICSHILSNHYNNTRPEYYRQIVNAGKTADLSGFIAYAVQGLLDGITETLRKAQKHQMRAAWLNHIHTRIGALSLQKMIRKRCIALLSDMDFTKSYSAAEILSVSPAVSAVYGLDGLPAVRRDLKRLVELELVTQEGTGVYKLNTATLVSSLPQNRKRHG